MSDAQALRKFIGRAVLVALLLALAIVVQAEGASEIGERLVRLAQLTMDNGPVDERGDISFVQRDTGAQIRRDQGSLDDAADDIEMSIQLGPNDASPYLTAGDIYHEMARLNKSVASYRQAARIDPDSWNAHYNIGFVCAEMGDTKEAVTAQTRAIEINATDARAWTQRGVSWGRIFNESGDRSDLRRAADDFREALRLDPKDANAKRNLEQAEQLLASPGR